MEKDALTLPTWNALKTTKVGYFKIIASAYQQCMCSNFKRIMHSKNEFFNLLLALQNNTEAGKRVSETESLLLLKNHMIFQVQMAHFGQCISTKDDPFVRSVNNRVFTTVYVYARSIRYAIECFNSKAYPVLFREKGSQFFR